MGSVPVVVYLVPVIGIAAAFLVPRFGQHMMKVTDRNYSEFRVGELAQRMGLQLVEGDPAFNMMQAQVSHNVSKAEAQGRGLRKWLELDTAQETRVRMEGAPYGRPTQFLYLARTKYADRVAVKFVTKELDCRLSIRVPVHLPPFEIVLRRPVMGQKAKPEMGLPLQSFGDTELDARLVLSCADPRLGPALAPVAAHLAAHQFLHIRGNGDIICSVATEAGVTSAITQIVETQHALEHMANVLTGPVAPRR